MKEVLYLALTKDQKQLGLFLTSDHAFAKFPEANMCEMWRLNEKTGQYHPTNASVGRLEMLPKKDESIPTGLQPPNVVEECRGE